ncbi:MAG: DUF4136 domain-containing protein [Gemmatimonadota bacterium]
MRATPAVLAMLGAALLAGCVPMTVQHDYDPDVDFSRYHSFTWMPVAENAETARTNLSGPFVDKRVKKALVEALAAKGYGKVDDGADFLVAYHLSYKRRTDVSAVRYGYWGPSYPVDVNQYKEGTLVLDLVDPQTQQLIWRGWSISALQPGADPREEQESIDMAVREILKRFPPY